MTTTIYTEAVPLTWLLFTALDDHAQQGEWRSRGDRVKYLEPLEKMR